MTQTDVAHQQGRVYGGAGGPVTVKKTLKKVSGEAILST